jgi:hypothetical protein
VGVQAGGSSISTGAGEGIVWAGSLGVGVVAGAGSDGGSGQEISARVGGAGSSSLAL